MKDYVGLARQYEADVLSGAIPACKWVRLACERNRRDLARAEAGDAGFPYEFRPDIAVRICLAAEHLPHIKGPKAKIVGKDDAGRAVWATIELEPHQCWFLTTLFGWVRRGTELRRFRVALYLVPRKNAKSTLAAIIVLYMLTADGESGAECYSAATTRDQAKTIAEVAWEMAKRSHDFRDYFGVKLGAKTTRSLEVPSTASKFLPLSADAHTLDSLNVSLAAIDELHAHKTRDVWGVLDTATGARLQSLLLATTTAGVDMGGICYEQLEYLRKVLSGVFEDETYFGVEYTIDEGDDWQSEASWRKANPNFGVSVQPEDMARKARQAARSGAAENNFKTKHLNVWTRAGATWFPLAEWQAQAAQLHLDDLVDVPCWISVDLAEVRDFASCAMVFRRGDDYLFLTRHYLPEESIERSPVAKMREWIKAGYVIETPGNITDYQRIEDDLLALCRSHRVERLCFDRALASRMMSNLVARLTPDMGETAAAEFVITVAQNREVINPAMALMESLVLAGHTPNDGNPVQDWMWSNVEVVRSETTQEMYPRKAGGKDSHNKIDGAMAILTALAVAKDGVVPASDVQVFVPSGDTMPGAAGPLCPTCGLSACHHMGTL